MATDKICLKSLLLPLFCIYPVSNANLELESISLNFFDGFLFNLAAQWGLCCKSVIDPNVSLQNLKKQSGLPKTVTISSVDDHWHYGLWTAYEAVWEKEGYWKHERSNLNQKRPALLICVTQHWTFKGKTQSLFQLLCLPFWEEKTNALRLLSLWHHGKANPNLTVRSGYQASPF